MSVKLPNLVIISGTTVITVVEEHYVQLLHVTMHEECNSMIIHSHTHTHSSCDVYH